MIGRVIVETLAAGTQTGGMEAEPVIGAGTYTRDDGWHFVEYEEKLDGLEAAAKVSLKFAPGKLLLTRDAEIRSEMEFFEDRPTVCRYVSPYGTIEMPVDTKRVFVMESEHGLSVLVHYDLTAGEERMEDCRVQIRIRKEN